MSNKMRLALCARALGCCLLAGALGAGRTPTAGAQTSWTATRLTTAGRDLNAVYFLNDKRGWVGGDGGLVWRTDDGGRSWVPQRLGLADSISDLYFRDKDNGYLLAGDSIFGSTDSGATWQPVRRFDPADFNGAQPELYSVRFANKKRGWVVGNLSRADVVTDSLVLMTTDGGTTWQRQPVPTRVELIHLDFVGDKRGWIVGDRGTILRTTDGGATWELQATSTNATLYHVDFLDEELGWIVGERGTILRTIDGGATWLAVPQTLTRAALLSVAFVNDDDGWAAGRGGVILRSGDGGRTWLSQETGTKQHLYALAMSKKRGVAVGADGLILQYER